MQHPVSSLCGQVLEQVECFNYLGVLLTSNLIWSKHDESMCKRLLGMIWFDHIWSMLHKYGNHTSKRISNCLRGSKICTQDVVYYNMNCEDLHQSFQRLSSLLVSHSTL